MLELGVAQGPLLDDGAQALVLLEVLLVGPLEPLELPLALAQVALRGAQLPRQGLPFGVQRPHLLLLRPEAPLGALQEGLGAPAPAPAPARVARAPPPRPRSSPRAPPAPPGAPAHRGGGPLRLQPEDLAVQALDAPLQEQDELRLLLGDRAAGGAGHGGDGAKELVRVGGRPPPVVPRDQAQVGQRDAGGRRGLGRYDGPEAGSEAGLGQPGGARPPEEGRRQEGRVAGAQGEEGRGGEGAARAVELQVALGEGPAVAAAEVHVEEPGQALQ